MRTQAKLEIPYEATDRDYRHHGKEVHVIRTDYCQRNEQYLALVQVEDRLRTFPCDWIRVQAVAAPEAATSEP